MPRESGLQRARMSDDVIALEALGEDADIARLASNREAVMQLWDVCQVPDYRKISTQNHAELISNLYKHLRGPGRRIPEDWFNDQVAFADRTDGDIDTLSTRLGAHPDMDVRRQPHGMARKAGRVAGAHPRDRRQTVGRAARVSNTSVCRQAYECSCQRSARQGRNERRNC